MFRDQCTQILGTSKSHSSSRLSRLQHQVSSRRKSIPFCTHSQLVTHVVFQPKLPSHEHSELKECPMALSCQSFHGANAILVQVSMESTGIHQINLEIVVHLNKLLGIGGVWSRKSWFVNTRCVDQKHAHETNTC